MHARILPAAEWPTLAPFLHAHNHDAALCLHSHAGDSIDAYRSELAAQAGDEAAFVVVGDDKQYAGCMGATFQVNGERAWLRGPIIDPALPLMKAAEIRAALWAQLSAVLPTAITRQDAFIALSNQALRTFYEQRQFAAQPHYFIYAATRSETQLTMPSNAHAASTAHHASLLELAASVFPKGHLSAAELTAENSDQHALFIVTEGNRVDGYVYANIAEPDSNDAELYIDYLAVRDEARGRGHGRALLQAALVWGYQQRGATRAALTVAADNSNAQGLYASVGFTLFATGVPMRRDIGILSSETTHSI